MGLLALVDVVKNARKSIFSLTILTSIVASGIVSGQEHNLHNKDFGQLPYCGEESQRTVSRRLLYVTTLDGKLSALDLSKNGNVHWSIPTGPGPLISSSIHRLELTNNGQFVRMIPSLSGGIYKFDGDSIDPLPISADHLLSSSFKFSDDLVISGGKETRSYGVSARTGQVLYECSMNGCANSTDSEALKASNDSDSHDSINADPFDVAEHDPRLDDVIVVRRQTQTVRAVESRTGNERWNFSVGHHELDLVKSAECHDRTYTDLDFAVLDLDFRIIVPDGILCAFSKSNPNVLLWKHKFDHPIVSVWKIGMNEMPESVDLFGSSKWLWNSETEHFLPAEGVNPSIYLGMYQKQLYIQESLKLRLEIQDKTNQFSQQLVSSESIMPKIPWRPLTVKSSSLVVFNKDDTAAAVAQPSSQGNELVPFDEENRAVAAQSVLYASEYVNGNGFYFYTQSDVNQTTASNALCADKNDTIAATSGESNGSTLSEEFNFNFSDTDTPVKIVILSLWFWWKEIAVISLTTAMLLNMCFSPRIRRDREIVVIERHIPVPTAIEATEETVVEYRNRSSGERTLSESNSQCSEYFTSRFQGDFDLIQCLGKGGFGVVFEAKNKLDDVNYAVKRIALPNKKESRERVMREVKTLANCEHPNIVRYFQAWVETPPIGWQEEEDLKWKQMSTSIEIETPDGTTLPPFSQTATGERNKSVASWVSSVASNNNNNKRANYMYANGRFDEKDEDDCRDDDDDDEESSSIVFRDESKSQALTTSGYGGAGGDCISIDMHMNGRTNDIDCSNLSDSFQIEFIRSTNGEKSEMWADSTKSKPTNGYRRPTSLDLSSHEAKQALIPLAAAAAATAGTVPSKIQNKVYLYIQMQLCRKQSLRNWLREHKLELRQPHIKSIFEQIVDAVDYVHTKGLIHRDLKPSNIFFSLDGQIKIGDFGLVTETSEMSDLTGPSENPAGRHTQQVGTHLYMSPEQLEGKHYDFKVDIFSLGLIFFELLVFFGTEMERMITLKSARDGKFPNEFDKEFPKEVDLLRNMLSAMPDRRPRANELKQKLMTKEDAVAE